jgi:hypothetical protein
MGVTLPLFVQNSPVVDTLARLGQSGVQSRAKLLCAGGDASLSALTFVAPIDAYVRVAQLV